MISLPQKFNIEEFDYSIHPDIELMGNFIKRGELHNQAFESPLDARFHLYKTHGKHKKYKIRHVGINVQANAVKGSITCVQELYLGDFTTLYAYGSVIRLGENVKISPFASIFASHHDTDDHEKYKCKPVTIGSDVWIAEGAKIMPGVTIANRVTIGANAVVTKDVLTEGAVVGGIPARLIK